MMPTYFGGASLPRPASFPAFPGTTRCARVPTGVVHAGVMLNQKGKERTKNEEKDRRQTVGFKVRQSQLCRSVAALVVLVLVIPTWVILSCGVTNAVVEKEGDQGSC